MVRATPLAGHPTPAVRPARVPGPLRNCRRHAGPFAVSRGALRTFGYPDASGAVLPAPLSIAPGADPQAVAGQAAGTIDRRLVRYR